jgi:hypothetical protein
MKIDQGRFDEERTVLIGMIVDKVVLGRISAKWERDMFRSPWANEISRWCVRYYRKYGKAPGTSMQGIYESYVGNGSPYNKEHANLIGTFLESLSEEYQRLQRESNSDHVMDLAGKYFNRIKLDRLSDAISGDIARGKVEDAEERALAYSRFEIGTGEIINVFDDMEHIRESFERNSEPVIKYKDGLGQFFSDRLERDGFIAFQAPEKRGKSFWLLDMAFRAVLQRRRVAFFECGDLSKHQIMKRFMTRVAICPVKPCTVVQ